MKDTAKEEATETESATGDRFVTDRHSEQLRPKGKISAAEARALGINISSWYYYNKSDMLPQWAEENDVDLKTELSKVGEPRGGGRVYRSAKAILKYLEEAEKPQRMSAKDYLKLKEKCEKVAKEVE